MISSSGRSLKFVRTSSPCSPSLMKYCSMMSSSAGPFLPVTALRISLFSIAGLAHADVISLFEHVGASEAACAQHIVGDDVRSAGSSPCHFEAGLVPSIPELGAELQRPVEVRHH